MVDDNLGGRLREALEVRQMSMAALAEAAGLPYRSVQNYAAGEQAPGASALLKIKRATNVSIDWLLTGEGEMFSPNEKSVSRPMSLKDYQYLRTIFSNFDEVFQIKDIWKFPDATPDADLELAGLRLAVKFSAASANPVIRERTESALAGRAVEGLAKEEALDVLNEAIRTATPE